jgi:hypothetical protein
LGDGRGDVGIENGLEDDIIWEVWAAEPLTDDTKLVIRWSRTTFFAGSPTSKPNIIDGKDFSLYHRCKDEAWARERFVHAKQYFQDVRLVVNGKLIEVAISSNEQPEPAEDMLGKELRLGSFGGC